MKIEELMEEVEYESKVLGELLDILDEFHGDELFASFTDIQKLGINPQTPYEDPVGVYSYPISYIIKESRDGEIWVPYGGDRPYIQIFNDLGNILDIRDYSESDLDRDKQLLIQEYYWLYSDDRAPMEKRDIEEIMDEEGLDFAGAVEYRINEYQNFAKNPLPFARLWDITFMMNKLLYKIEGKNFSFSWNKILRSTLGFRTIVDYGNGIINMNEETQALHLNGSTLEHIDTIYNKDSKSK